MHFLFLLLLQVADSERQVTDAEERVAEAEGLVREAALEKEREKKALVDGQKGEEEERVRAARLQAQEEEALRMEAEEKVGVGAVVVCRW